MGPVVEFVIESKNVHLENGITLNNITVSIDLTKVWNKSIGYTDFYVNAVLNIPVIENITPKNMQVTLEGIFLVSSIEADRKPIEVILTGQCPGQIDLVRQPSGTAQVLFYTVTPI